MANYRVAKRYAKAFMEVLPENKLEQAVQEMKDIVASLKGSKQLRSFFRNPIISEAKKQVVAKELFKGYSSETQNLIQLLIKNTRIENLKEVADSFIQQYRVKKGMKKLTITSAYPLVAQQIDSIIDKVKNDLSIEKDKIEIEQKIDESLIGGFVLRVDDKQFDSSIKTRLNRIRKELDTTQI